MLYTSTRENAEQISSADAILRGIAPDGGLYMPKSISASRFDYKKTVNMSTKEIAVYVLSTLFDDFGKGEMKKLVEAGYDKKFETDELTPTVKVGDDFVLELFRGPTSAFKDVALSMLPQLITASRKKLGIVDETLILTATSGDTGKAALEGFHDVDGTKIIVFYPENGVSAVQKAQMVTQEGKNVCVCAVKGNFDDAQTGVKNIFAKTSAENLLDGTGVSLSSANSINIGRLAPQIVYYFKAYADLVNRNEITLGDKINFVVPTGNFGDILAGYFAKLMGLPVEKLVCASNANNVLTDFIKSGVYDKRRTFYKTTSPSMDILVSSNLERLLYLLSGCNCKEISGYMKELNENGSYMVSEDIFKKLNEEFFGEYCDEDETAATIKKVYEKYGYLLDTHTAVAWNVMEKYKAETGDTLKTVVLSTASPYKFSKSVSDAVGLNCDDDEFAVMENLSKATGIPVPNGLKDLDKREVLHKNVINKEEMLDFVLGKAREKQWQK